MRAANRDDPVPLGVSPLICLSLLNALDRGGGRQVGEDPGRNAQEKGVFHGFHAEIGQASSDDGQRAEARSGALKVDEGFLPVLTGEDAAYRTGLDHEQVIHPGDPLVDEPDSGRDEVDVRLSGQLQPDFPGKLAEGQGGAKEPDQVIRGCGCVGHGILPAWGAGREARVL
jgi:hypothetical protein